MTAKIKRELMVGFTDRQIGALKNVCEEREVPASQFVREVTREWLIEHGYLKRRNSQSLDDLALSQNVAAE
jgi:hypothetical protein